MNHFQEAHSEEDDLERAIEEELRSVRMSSLACAAPSGRVSHDDARGGLGKTWARACLLAVKGALEAGAGWIRRMAATLEELAATLPPKKATSS